jgi:biotin carboxyl carrier protein
MSETKGRRRLRFWGGLFLFLVIIALLPWRERAVGECQLLPTKRTVVVAETTGRLTEVSVKEGTLVAADQSVAKLDTLTIETNLEISRQERMRYESDLRKAQSAGDMPAYQTAFHQARKAAEQENKLQQDVARAELRSPIAGIILTKDVELRRGEVLPIGKEFCEIASLEDWNLQIDVDEADFGVVEDALRNGRSVEVEYILFARSGMKLHAKLNSIEQLSQMAYAKGTENVFYATVTGIPLPSELQRDIRPGFSGKARIVMERRPLFRVVSRKFIHFLRVHFLL